MKVLHFGAILSTGIAALFILSTTGESLSGEGYREGTSLSTALSDSHSQCLLAGRSILTGSPMTVGWTNVTSSVGHGPSPRDLAGMTYDSADGYLLLFGGLGRNYTVLGDTWILRGGHWSILNPSNSPSPRYDFRMAYDPVDKYVIGFGGEWVRPTGHFFESHQTWIFKSGNWTDITPSLSISPPGRSGAGFVFDELDGYAVLFGGITVNNSGSFHLLHDTWTFAGGKWALVNTSGQTSPPGRSYLQMAFDRIDGYVLLFGGAQPPLWHVLSGTWKFSAGTWALLSTAIHPAGRYAGAEAFDNNSSEVVLFGGHTAHYTWFYRTWTFQGGNWSLFNGSGPSPRETPAFAYDESLHKIVLFGGFTSTPPYWVGDTWEFAG